MFGTLAFPRKVSDEAKDFITSCLSLEASARPTMQELMRHPWLRRIELEDESSEIVSGVTPISSARSSSGRGKIRGQRGRRAVRYLPLPVMLMEGEMTLARAQASP